MLTLFRKIRKTLLVSGATGKYLLYAVGEIALVVIGILIALQINNWNTFRVERKVESEYLQRIADELKVKIEHLKNAKSEFGLGQTNASKMLDYWNSSQAFVETENP